ncbi:MAG: hypothetical protein V2A54_16330 [Bacteroidota bacterium]
MRPTHKPLRKTSKGRAWQAPSYKQILVIVHPNRKPEYALVAQANTEAFPQFRMSGVLLTYQ